MCYNSEQMDVKDFELQEITALGIPVSLRPAFQEYELEQLDPELDAFTVIERTLGKGDVRELRWLFKRYGAERLRVFIEKFGIRFLPRPRLQYWSLYFALAIEFPQDRIWNH